MCVCVCVCTAKPSLDGRVDGQPSATDSHELTVARPKFRNFSASVHALEALHSDLDM